MLKQANLLDCQASREKGLDAALLDRLELTDDRVGYLALLRYLLCFVLSVRLL